MMKISLIKTEDIIKYLNNLDDELDTLIICNPKKNRLVCRDLELYEAITILKGNYDFNRLRKFLEVVDIISYQNITGKPKPIITEERIKELNKNIMEEI